MLSRSLLSLGRVILDHHETPYEVMVEFMRLVEDVRRVENACWSLTSDVVDPVSENYYRGKAHVLCDVLGDQEALALVARVVIDRLTVIDASRNPS